MQLSPYFFAAALNILDRLRFDCDARSLTSLMWPIIFRRSPSEDGDGDSIVAAGVGTGVVLPSVTDAGRPGVAESIRSSNSRIMDATTAA